MVGYLKAGPQVRTYSNYLRATREAEKEDSLELSRSSRTQLANGLSKPRPTSFFPLRKLKGNQPLSKKPAICLVQLEEEEADDGKDPESDDPDGIEGVIEEFMVWLARVVKILRWMRNAVTVVVDLNTLSITVHLWKPLETRYS